MQVQTRCDTGKYTATEGLSTCLLTEPGKEANGDKTGQVDCAEGETSESGGVCEACDPGSYASAAGSPRCALASEGHYVKDSDRTQQFECPVGHYAPGPGTINECLECALGTYAESEQSEECDSARPGWYVDEKGASEEKECKRGTYTETEGQSSCSDARAGYFVDADGASDR